MGKGNIKKIKYTGKKNGYLTGYVVGKNNYKAYYNRYKPNVKESKGKKVYKKLAQNVFYKNCRNLQKGGFKKK